MTAGMEFGLLGTVLARSNETIIEIQQGKLRAVLAALLLDANKTVTTESLIDTLWGDDPPPSARQTVAVYINRLRDRLGDDGRALITTCPPGYLIRVADSELDIARFKAHVVAAQAAARRGAWEDVQASADAALALWRGEPLTDVDSELLREREVPYLAELRMQALEARLDADLHLGFHTRAAAELRKLTAAQPGREQLHARLMLALYLSDRQADALAAYRHAQRVLDEQFGTEPGPALADLHQKILKTDPGLAAQFSAQPGAPHQKPRGPGGRHEQVPPDQPGRPPLAAAGRRVPRNPARVPRIWPAGIAGAVLVMVVVLTGWTVIARAGSNDRTGATGPTCPFIVDANNINIRYTPDGPATGNTLSKGDIFIANEIYGMTPGGQQWIGGWYSQDPKWIGWVGRKYLHESGPDSCIGKLPVKH